MSIGSWHMVVLSNVVSLSAITLTVFVGEAHSRSVSRTVKPPGAARVMLSLVTSASTDGLSAS